VTALREAWLYQCPPGKGEKEKRMELHTLSDTAEVRSLEQVRGSMTR
jgi:hypothetical protein